MTLPPRSIADLLAAGRVLFASIRLALVSLQPQCLARPVPLLPASEVAFPELLSLSLAGGY